MRGGYFRMPYLRCTEGSRTLFSGRPPPPSGEDLQETLETCIPFLGMKQWYPLYGKWASGKGARALTQDRFLVIPFNQFYCRASGPTPTIHFVLQKEKMQAMIIYF